MPQCKQYEQFKQDIGRCYSFSIGPFLLNNSILEVVKVQARSEMKEEKSAILSIIEFDKWPL